MSDYHRREQPQSPAAPAAQHPYYYCTRCQGEKFTLGPAGEVECGGCGALMRNLEVRNVLTPPCAPAAGAPAGARSVPG